MKLSAIYIFILALSILSDYSRTLQFLNPAAFGNVPVNSVSKATIRPGNVA